MKSHSEGEVWGLSVVGTNGVMTSGDDNKMIFWNYAGMVKKSMFGDLIVTNEARKLQRSGASTLSTFPDSQCSRAITA
jgi:hypothetical protein